MQPKKKNILEKIIKKDYNDELEKILEEKNIIAKQIQKRGWITVLIGFILSGGMIYTSKVLADNGLFGLCQVFTMGMLGFTGIIMANGMFSIRGGKKL